MSLRDVLLCQPDFAHEPPVTTLPWLEPPFAVPSAPVVLDTPREQRTSEEVAEIPPGPFRGQEAKGDEMDHHLPRIRAH